MSRKPALIDFPTPPAVPGARTDPIRAEVARTLRAKREAWETQNALRMVDGEPAAPGVAIPAAGSLTEAVAAAAGVANLHRGAADTALALADQERDRRVEAEERAGGAFQAGQQEANSVWSKFAEITQGYQGTILALVQEGHKAQVEALQQRQADVLAQINENIKAALAAKDTVIAAKDEKITALTGQVQTLSQRQTVEQALAEAITSGDPRSHPAVKRVMSLFGERAGKTREDLEIQFLEDQANDHIEERREAREAARQEREDRRTRGKKTEDLLDGLTGIVKAARPAIPYVLAAAAGVTPPMEEPDGWSPVDEGANGAS